MYDSTDAVPAAYFDGSGSGEGTLTFDHNVGALYTASDIERAGTTTTMLDADLLRDIAAAAVNIGWDEVILEVGADIPALLHPAGERMDRDEWQRYQDGADLEDIVWEWGAPDACLALAPRELRRLPVEHSAALVPGRNSHEDGLATDEPAAETAVVYRCDVCETPAHPENFEPTGQGRKCCPHCGTAINWAASPDTEGGEE